MQLIARIRTSPSKGASNPSAARSRASGTRRRINEGLLGHVVESVLDR